MSNDMNLIQKLFQYIRFRRENINNAYKRTFDTPLTDEDKFMLVSIFIAICLVSGFVYKNKVDDKRFKAEQAKVRAEMKIKREASRAIFWYNKAKKTERVLVSALNGTYKENGRIVTVCRLNAAGDCE